MPKESTARITYEPLLTVAEVAKIFRLTEAGIRKMIKGKRLPAVRLGREYRIPQYAVNNIFSPFSHITPEEAGFGMWKTKGPRSPEKWVREIREKDPRTLDELLNDLKSG